MLCHRRPDRSFFWKGQQLPVCARCTGTHVGYLSLLVFPIAQTHLGWGPAAVMLLPALLDGGLQASTSYESNNILRVITGFLLGVGVMSLLAGVGQSIGNYLLTFIQTSPT